MQIYTLFSLYNTKCIFTFTFRENNFILLVLQCVICKVSFYRLCVRNTWTPKIESNFKGKKVASVLSGIAIFGIFISGQVLLNYKDVKDSTAKISILKHFSARCEATFFSDTDDKLVESHKNKDLCRFYAIISYILFRFGVDWKTEAFDYYCLIGYTGRFFTKNWFNIDWFKLTC